MHHLRVQEILKAKLRESQESDLPESQASNSENESKVKLRDKTYKKGCEGETVTKNRISQSISSEDEADQAAGSQVDNKVGCETKEKSQDIEDIGNKTLDNLDQNGSQGNKTLDNLDQNGSQDLASIENIKKLQVKSKFEGVSKYEHSSLIEKSKGETVQTNEIKTEQSIILTTNSDKQESHSKGANDVEESVETHESSFVDISFESTGTSNMFSGLDEVESTSNEGLAEPVPDVILDNPKVESSVDDISKNVSGIRNRKHPAVHFIAGSDLVMEREITPLCSRDSTPTHTQSEVVIPVLNASTKRLRRVTTKSKSESDTESDEGESYHVRRRKARLQDNKENGTGRSSLAQTSRKTNAACSSTEGETEAQASECGRRVSFTFPLVLLIKRLIN